MRYQKAFVMSLLGFVLLSGLGFHLIVYQPYPFVLPASLPKYSEPPHNPTTVEGAYLGKKLFYDTSLSVDNTIACVSCHKQEFAFGDSSAFSKGVRGQLGKRNTLPLFNLAWQQELFWDSRVASLEELVFHPIIAKDEMDMDTALLCQKLAHNPIYPQLFAAAFGSNKISNKRVAKAIAQYIRTLTSYNTKLDTLYEYLNTHYKDIQRNDVGKIVAYSPKVSSVLILCEKCHNGESYGGIQHKNNGLDQLYTDKGNSLYNSERKILFKVPSLRNLQLTAPYMHDGRFRTIDEVLEHYNSGIQASPDLSEELKDSVGNPIRLHLSEEDQKQIREFITIYTHDPVFANKKEYQNN
jgi:cytochrome c peroxidase